jgi:hypothetical protein
MSILERSQFSFNLIIAIATMHFLPYLFELRGRMLYNMTGVDVIECIRMVFVTIHVVVQRIFNVDVAFLNPIPKSIL